MIAYDGTEHSRRAIDYAAKFLRFAARDVEAIVVHAWESTPHQTMRLSALAGFLPPAGAADNYTHVEDPQHLEAARVIADGVEYATGRGLRASGELIEVASTVWGALVHASEEFDVNVIVTGSRGASGIKALLHSSVSEHLLKNCHKPVLIVPSGCPNA